LRKSGIPNSFLDLLGQNSDLVYKKIGKKSLAYDQLKLKKMRAMYGRRATFKLNIKNEDGKDVEEEKKKVKKYEIAKIRENDSGSRLLGPPID